MSLWTPDGEHEVPRDQPAPAAAAATAPAGAPAAAPSGAESDSSAPSFDDLSPEEQAQAEAIAAEMAEARTRLAETPASMVVANHAMGLYELAAIHLSDDPPKLDESKIAIDAMGAIIDSLPGRLGEHEETLRAARSQIQLAYVELGQQADD